MSLLAGVIAPHPPILMPQIGGEYLKRLEATISGLHRASAALDRIEIEALVVVSPHSPLFQDRFVVRIDKEFEADFTKFGAPEPRFSIDNDLDTALTLATAQNGGGSVQTWESPDGRIDWGVSVPYFYLGKNRPIVSISISTLSYEDHWQLGQRLGRILNESPKRWAFIASGDLSHRLTPDAPYGFSSRGLEFDRLVGDLISTGRLADFKEIDSDLIEAAGECGLRSFIMMAGALSSSGVEAEVLSYEGPFGVGYLVANMLVKEVV